MRTRWLGRLLREETASSLLVTLVMITIVTLVIGAVMALYQAQYRFIRRDVHRLQARYAAEAGVYVMLDSLRRRPTWRPDDHVVNLPDGQTSQVSVEAYGGYLYLRSVARHRRSRSTVRALVGAIAPTDFHQAIYLWDIESRLHVAGTTQITGDLIVGPRGMQERTFKNRRFTGRVEGTVHATPELQAPFYDGRALGQSLEALDALLVGTSQAVDPGQEPIRLAERLPSENPVHRVAGSLRLTPADSLLLRTPLTVVATGHLTLEGPLRFQPGTLFIAGQTLTVGAEVTGRDGLFYGRDAIEMEGPATLSGQFFSHKNIQVGGEVYLRYPSVLYITGDAGVEAGVPNGVIRIEDDAAVDGVLIHPPLEPPPTVPRGRVVIEPAAHVRGAIFNAHATEMHGTLYGTLLTHQLYFYESPTSYVNWLKDTVLDVTERPVKFLLPLGFSPWPRLAVLGWETTVEEPAPPS